MIRCEGKLQIHVEHFCLMVNYLRMLGLDCRTEIISSDSCHKFSTGMAKGSQLTQLKVALSQAGLTAQNKGKKRKRSVVAPEKDKEKRAAQLDEIRRRLNPFDVKVTNLKHDVGGRKLKGVSGKPAQSKQAGIEQVCRCHGCRNQVDHSYYLIAAEEDIAERA